MLPEPMYCLTIPSVRDGIDLECRVYHPSKFRATDSTGGWLKKGAVVAHPYAPMGGCFDDPVVCSITSVLLKQDYIVALFNFRGAGTSKGRTSWTSKPEIDDYVSVTGFMLHYLRYIEPPIAPSSASSSILGPQSSPLATIQSAAVAEPEVNQTPRETTLLLGGYSYGSMIATSVPSIESIMSRFEQAAKGSNEEEIHLRAARLCRQWNAEARERQRGRPLTAAESGPRSSSSVLCGGEESEPGTRRLSRDSRRSIDVVRRSVDRTRRKMSRKSQRSDESLHKQELQSTPHTTPRICYLLVSPLLPPVSSFLTVFANSHLFGRHATPTLDTSKLSRHPTLAVWGDGDFFTSSKKLSRWAGGLSGASASLFEYVQIEDAGHFWHEVGVEPQLKNAIKRWLTALER